MATLFNNVANTLTTNFVPVQATFDASGNFITFIGPGGVAFTTGGGGGGLTINTSTITGGTSGRILYDNGGTVGEKATTGTGNVVLSASPTLSGTVNLSSLTASQAVFTDASNNLVSVATTGTGSVVLSASPTMTGSVVVSGTNSNITVNSLYFGRGISNDVRNLGLGSNIPYINAGDGRYLTALGTNTLANYGNAPAVGNLNNSTAVGYNALANNSDGSDNTAVGYNTGGTNVNGTNERNTFIGSKAGLFLDENCTDNVFLGYNSNPYTTTQIASRSIVIGSNAKNALNAVYNTVVIGDSAVGHPDNSVTIGNSDMTNTYINGLGFNFGTELPTSGTLNGSLNLLTTNNINLTKTINIGTGTSSGFSAINIGASTYTTTVNGALIVNAPLTVNGLFKPAQSASDPTYVKGAIYFDTTRNKLRVGGATGWETITSI